MNFISRNLGWILLFLFFLFMLFIISTNQKKDIQEPNSTGTMSVSTESGAVSLEDEDETTGELDSLIDQLGEDIVSDEADTNQEAIVEEDSQEAESGRSIFDFFTRDSSNQEEEQEEDINQEDMTSTGETLEEQEEGEEVQEGVQVGEQKSQQDTMTQETESDVKQDSVSVDPTLGLVKNTGTTTTKAVNYAFHHISPVSLPGVNLHTMVGKQYKIGVHSLRLNNAHFNETLAYMMKNDVVEQLTSENRYGCFQVQIIDSVHSHNNGKKGYVCKKYLTDTEVDTSSDTIKFTDTSSAIEYTAVGSYYKISVEGSCFEEKDSLGNDVKYELNQGDVLKQISEVNPDNGCTKMQVVGANVYENHGKIITVCSGDMVTPVE